MSCRRRWPWLGLNGVIVSNFTRLQLSGKTSRTLWILPTSAVLPTLANGGWLGTQYAPLSSHFISCLRPIIQHIPPDFSADMYSPENMIAWNNLFTELELVFHVSNMVLEQIDYGVALKYKELKEAIIQDNNHLPGGLMGIHESHWPNIAVHANQNPDDDHKDDLSSHLGFDNILPFGDFHDGWLLFPGLGIHIGIFPGDVILIRGASLSHQAWGWRGNGRFVVVPFAEHHLFPVECVGRIRHPTPIFGDQYSKARKQCPAKDLPTFVWGKFSSININFSFIKTPLLEIQAWTCIYHFSCSLLILGLYHHIQVSDPLGLIPIPLACLTFPMTPFILNILLLTAHCCFQYWVPPMSCDQDNWTTTSFCYWVSMCTPKSP